ncbi:hypothetical protein Taro_004183, partial [Colocasia esculenta]|nr:hypothetical protein [Colocasia esculenta]
MAAQGEKAHGDIEAGAHQPPEADGSDASDCFSDAEDQSWHSSRHSYCAEASFDELRLSNASVSDHEAGVPETYRASSVSKCSLEIDLESGVPEIKVDTIKDEKDCRICHLSLVDCAQESGSPIELGCSCKDDLATAHRQCAETWFKIKGNKTCEICGSIAKNVAGTGEAEFIEQWNDANSTAPAAPPTENRSFWHGHRFLNFLLACMVFAFVISWLFHFNAP